MFKRNVLLIAFLLLTAALAACSTTPSAVALKIGPQSWIDAPLDGSNLPLAAVQVVSHAADVYSIVLVELSVNGQVINTTPNPDSNQSLVRMTQTWSPNAPGNYTLTVRAQNQNGVWGAYARTVVTIGPITATLTPTAPTTTSPFLTATPNPTATLPLTFRLTPTPRDTRGPLPPTLVSPIGGTAVDCGSVTLTWNSAQDPSGIRNYDVELEKLADSTFVTDKTWNAIQGNAVSFNPACDTRYRWQVRATDNVGNQGNWSRYGFFRVREAVSPPTAPTRTPTPRDTQGPPPPVLAAPINGATVPCNSVTLTWNPAQDPSGIRNYDVELEKLVDRAYVTDKTWNNVGGTSVSFNPACDTHYRWRVRATDNAGNQGNWSDYEDFQVWFID